MPNFAERSEFKAAIAAIGQGSLNQIRVIGDKIEKIEDRVEQVEQGGGQQQTEPQPQPSSKPDLSGVQSVSAVSDGATASQVRTAVQDLAKQFNALVEAMKNG